MPKGYWIVRADVTDPEQYQQYVRANAAAFEKYQARFLVRGGQFENPEGTAKSRNVVIEFPTYQMAIDCWHSSEYQTALKLRRPAADLDMVIIEGYEGIQPGDSDPAD